MEIVKGDLLISNVYKCFFTDEKSWLFKLERDVNTLLAYHHNLRGIYELPLFSGACMVRLVSPESTLFQE
jgi:hypothetical protein